MRRHRRVLLVGFIFILVQQSQAQPTAATSSLRKWHDASGRYSVEASFVNADDELVVLEAKDELLVVQRNELSESDRKYVTTQLAAANESPKNLPEQKSAKQKTEAGNVPEVKNKTTKYDSTWTLRDGEVVRGLLVAFGEQKVVVNREKGKLYVDGRLWEELPSAYRKIVPDVVATQDKVEISNAEALEGHLAERGGGPITYRVEGVQVLLESGEKTTIPVTLLSKHEMDDVLPGFRRWKAAQAQDVDDKDRTASSKVERLLLEAHGRNPSQRLLRQQRKLQFLQLSLLASDVGATNLWQVALHSGRPYTFPNVVLVPAQNSLIAQRRALAKYPGWKAVGARQLDR